MWSSASAPAIQRSATEMQRSTSSRPRACRRLLLGRRRGSESGAAREGLPAAGHYHDGGGPLAGHRGWAVDVVAASYPSHSQAAFPSSLALVVDSVTVLNKLRRDQVMGRSWRRCFVVVPPGRGGRPPKTTALWKGCGAGHKCSSITRRESCEE
jgi:hypothetical protein